MDSSKLYDILGYRVKIDKIDLEICDLLKARMEIMHKVRVVKEKYVKQGSTIRPSRAVEVIYNACLNLFPLYPKQVVINIWRNFISISEYNEQKFSIIALNRECYWLGREFFGNFIENKIESNAEKLIAYLGKNDTHFGFVPFPDKNQNDKWWIYLINSNIKVFAVAPLFKGDEKSVLVLGNVLLEPSKGEDFTLIATELLEKIEQDYQVIDTHKVEEKNVYLVRLAGFYSDVKHAWLIGTYSLIDCNND
ncbi:MAG: chorismate mutase [Rickettsiaceae bacterium H1]|nr:chorismate mutase [Rickettsiaceae bacterium H1]